MAFNKYTKRDGARILISLKETRRGAWRMISGANLEREVRRFRNGKNQVPSHILDLRRHAKINHIA